MQTQKASITYPWPLKTPCSLCRQYHNQNTPICNYCEHLFVPLGPACKQCATPLPEWHFPQCAQCREHPPFIDAVFAPYQFEAPLRTLLHDFKYREKLHLSLFLAEQMQHTPPIFEPNHTCLIPIPLHQKRLQTRGFNQAAVLAKQLAKQLELPYCPQFIQKIKNTLPQAELEAKKRKKNIKNAFLVKKIHYPHVILIDDLITTGSTANELAHQLKSNGTQQVSLWCLAKTCLT